MSFRFKIGVFIPVSLVVLLSFQNCSVYKGEGVKYLEENGHNLSSTGSSSTNSTKLANEKSCLDLELPGLVSTKWINSEYQKSCVININRQEEHSIVCNSNMDHLSLFLSLQENDPNLEVLDVLKESESFIIFDKQKSKLQMLSLDSQKESASLCYEIVSDSNHEESIEILQDIYEITH